MSAHRFWSRAEMQEHKINLKKQVYDRENGQCFWCDKPLTFYESTLDHIIPRSRRGRMEYGNLLLSCKTCNCERGDKDASGYLVQITYGV